MKKQSAPQEAKKFKFRFTPMMIILAIAVILLCIAGIVLSILRIINEGINGFSDALKSPFLILICLFGITVVIALLIRSQYVITDREFITQFGFIKSKFPLDKFTAITLDTDQRKLTVNMNEEFFIISTHPDWNNDLAQALRERNPNIEFSFTVADKPESKK